tara:strand:- start:38 stop:262 length:225 start_codon:yes stop_codon:yes gene_type:complete
LRRKSIRNKLLKVSNNVTDDYYIIISVNKKNSEIQIVGEGLSLDTARKKVDNYISDNVKLYIQDKNSNRIVYTR